VQINKRGRMLLEKSISCSKCKKVTPLNEIRADSSANDWICIECYNSQHKRLQKTSSYQEEIKQSRRSFIKPHQSIRVKMRCMRCPYVFLVAEDKIPALCPYCGRENTLSRT